MPDPLSPSPVLRRRLLSGVAAMALLGARATPADALVGGRTAATGFGSLGMFDNPGGRFAAQAIAADWVITAGHVAPEPRNATWTGSDGARPVIAVHPLRLAAPDATSPVPGLRADDIVLLQLAPSGTAMRHRARPSLASDWPPMPGPGGLVPVTMVSPERDAPGHRIAQGSVLGIERRLGFGLLFVRGEDGAAVVSGDSGSPLFAGAPAALGPQAAMLGVATAIAREPGGASIALYLALAPYRAQIDAALATTGERATWVSLR